MANLFFYQTAMGKVGIAEDKGSITDLYLPGYVVPQDATIRDTELLSEAAEQLFSYLSGRRKEFTIPLAPSGTKFMQRVWKELQSIPYGQTRSYQEVARSIGNEYASRAVGLACKRNPIPIFIPCHRVIGADRGLTGYRGGLEIKASLLKLERDDGDI